LLVVAGWALIATSILLIVRRRKQLSSTPRPDADWADFAPEPEPF
jgi:hypothetical protein